jgi:type I restriction enzyme S subunit
VDQRNSGYPVLKIRDIDHCGRFNGSFGSFVDPEYAQKHRPRWAKAGDTLILNAAHQASHVASKLAMVGPDTADALLTGEWLVVRPDGDEVDPAFLHYWISSTKTRLALRDMVKGIHLYPRDVAALHIDLPPLAEQRRIAAILDQAEEVRHRRTRLIADLDFLAVAIFNDRFSSGVYPSLRLGDMAEIKGGKRLPKGTPYADRPTKHPYIRVVDLRGDGVIDERDLCFITEETHQQIARYVVDEDDVVISIAGTIGLTAAVPESLVGANLTENAARIVPRAGSEYRAEWLAAALRTPQMQAQIRGHVGQVTIGKLALFRIEKLELEVPPLAVQDEYLGLVRATRELARRVTDCSALDDQLVASLQAHAFSGKS